MKAPIAQRGHAKQKRHDLRLVGLGLVVTSDGGVPLVSHAYAGQPSRFIQFATMIDELVARYRDVVSSGRRADRRLRRRAGTPRRTSERSRRLRCTSSARCDRRITLICWPSTAPLPEGELRFDGVTAFESHAETLGGLRRVVVTHSQNLHAKQSAGFDQTLAKASTPPRASSGRLWPAVGAARAAPPSKPRSARSCAPMAGPGRLGTLAGRDARRTLRLTWRVDATARTASEPSCSANGSCSPTTRTGLAERSSPPIARSSNVEADFRQMKDPTVVSFSPMFHWTDQKIRVHVFYCVLALTRRPAHAARGTNATGCEMSVREVLANLGRDRRDGIAVSLHRGRPKARRMLTEMDPIQQRLYDLFDLRPTLPKLRVRYYTTDFTITLLTWASAASLRISQEGRASPERRGRSATAGTNPAVGTRPRS